MKLSQSQIQDIEGYLNYYDLRQIDLRYEVQDHMIVAIEQSLAEGISYKDAFNQQKEKWYPELKSYSSFWLGLAFSGPKMMIKKCVKIIKNVFLKTIPITLIISCFFSFLFDFMPKNLIGGAMNLIVGVVFSCLFLLSVAWYFSIKTSNIKTSYQFLYKMHSMNIWLFFFSFIISSPKVKHFFSTDMDFLSLFGSIFLLVSYHHLFKIYQKHNRVIKKLA